MFGDIYNIRERVQKIDKRFDIKYTGEGNYTITQNGLYFIQVSHNELDSRVLDKVREIVWRNENADILKEIEENNSKLDAAKEKERRNLSEDIAKDIKPYLNRL